jgi:hypothetical protein
MRFENNRDRICNERHQLVSSANDVNQLTASKMVGINVNVRKWISSHLSGMQDKITIWS